MLPTAQLESVAESAGLQWVNSDADKIAAVGGSWYFIGGFILFLIVWVTANTMLLTQDKFDPYPFIFLNLMLSMLAAVQAPVILMSQNRQARKDRITARHDYEVNLRTQLEILRLSRRIEVLAEDVRKIARSALRHRLHRSFEAEAEGVSNDEIARRVIASKLMCRSAIFFQME